MSAAVRTDSGWLKQNYEKILLILALVAVLASSLWLVISIGNAQRASEQPGAGGPTGDGHNVDPIDREALDPRLAPLHQPFTHTSRTNTMMVSELRVTCVSPSCGKPIPYNVAICPFCKVEQPEVVDIDQLDDDQDGMPNVFEKEHDLDPLNRADAFFDKDGDGFNNLEEFTEKTDPSDATDYPDPPAKLRLVGIRKIPFVFLFQGTSQLPQGTRYMLNTRSLDRSHFVKLGDVVDGYLVKEFNAQGIDGKPTLILEKEGEVIPLVKGSTIRDRYEVVAGLVFLLDRSKFKVRERDSIELMGHTYNVVDIRENAVSIRDIKSGKMYRAGRLTEEERQDLRGAPRDRFPGAGPAVGRPRGSDAPELDGGIPF